MPINLDTPTKFQYPLSKPVHPHLEKYQYIIDGAGTLLGFLGFDTKARKGQFHINIGHFCDSNIVALVIA